MTAYSITDQRAECAWCTRPIPPQVDAVYDDLTDGWYHPDCFELVEEYGHGVREAFRELERDEA